jgi:hypothetical protein
MREIESPAEAYLTAERTLVAAVDAAGGAVPLPDGRTITVGRAEFDALLGERRKRASVIIKKASADAGAAMTALPYPQASAVSLPPRLLPVAYRLPACGGGRRWDQPATVPQFAASCSAPRSERAKIV